MRKSYFLKYGTDKDKSEIRALLGSIMDLMFVEHDSEYFGVYFLYSGLYADRLKIGDNYVSHAKEWVDGVSRCKTLINLSFTEGKNADKLSRFKYMKDVFENLDELIFLDEQCLEDES